MSQPKEGRHPPAPPEDTPAVDADAVEAAVGQLRTLGYYQAWTSREADALALWDGCRRVLAADRIPFRSVHVRELGDRFRIQMSAPTVVADETGWLGHRPADKPRRHDLDTTVPVSFVRPFTLRRYNLTPQRVAAAIRANPGSENAVLAALGMPRGGSPRRTLRALVAMFTEDDADFPQLS